MPISTKQSGEELAAIEKRKVKNWWARISLSWDIILFCPSNIIRYN